MACCSPNTRSMLLPKVPSRKIGIEPQKLRVKWLSPPIPEPPDRNMDLTVKEDRTTHCVVEERNMADEQINSHRTSTGEAQANTTEVCKGSKKIRQKKMSG